MDPEALLLIGKIVAAHGIKGEVKVYPQVEQQTLFNPGRAVLVGSGPTTGSTYTIASSRVVKKAVCIRFESVNDRSQAESFAGYWLYVARSALPPPETDTWYWCDLIGMDVYDMSEGFIGRVAAMIETGANDVFVVRNNENERLVPAAEPIVKSIDQQAGRILVQVPEGL